jgi:hypothetical protein
MFLKHFDLRLRTVIETDASNFVIRVIFLPVENGCIKPIAIYLRKLDKAEINYEIYNKKLLAIISAFKK